MDEKVHIDGCQQLDIDLRGYEDHILEDAFYLADESVEDASVTSSA